MPFPAFYLGGDSYPGCRHAEEALRQRLAPGLTSWTGQATMQPEAADGRIDRRIDHRLAVLERFVRESAPAGDAQVLGRSSGARVASLLALRTPVRGVICFGYPFRRADRPGPQSERFEHLAHIGTPVLIFQGLSDPYGGRDIRTTFALSERVSVEFLDCDHGLRLHPTMWDRVAERILAFVARLPARGRAIAAAGPAPH